MLIVKKLRQIAELACTAGAVLRLGHDQDAAEEDARALVNAAETILREVREDLMRDCPSAVGIEVMETLCGNS